LRREEVLDLKLEELHHFKNCGRKQTSRNMRSWVAED
jgi:hypothetical protein